MTRGLHLTVLAGPAVPVPLPRAVLEALLRVQVTAGAGEASGFQLTFALSTRSPLHTLFLATAGQAPLLRVIIAVTMGGAPQVLMDGVVTHHEVTPGSEPGMSQLTLNGTDLSALMDLIALDGFPYPATPPEARVALMLLKYAFLGIIPIIIPVLFPDVPDPAEQIPKHQGTDLAYLRRLACAAGYIFYLEPGPAIGTSRAYWGPEIKVGVPQPALNLDFDAHRNVESLQFAFDSTHAELPVVVVQNRRLKIPIAIPIPGFNPLQPPLGIFPPLPRRASVMDEAAKLSLPEALGRAVGIAARSSEAVTASGSLDVTRYGRLLEPRKLVGVRGAGFAYDGLYYVKSVTTTLARGECKQSFQLSRNALVSITPKVPV